MRLHHQGLLIVGLASLSLSSCAEWSPEEIASAEQESGNPLVLTIKPPAVKIWENQGGVALWTKGIDGAMVVLYPAKRGWGALLFSKKPGQKSKLIADYQGKSENLGEFLAANHKEWNTLQTPGSDLDSGILGSLKKKPPGDPSPPGQDPKVKQIESAQAVAEASLGELKVHAGQLKVEF